MALTPELEEQGWGKIDLDDFGSLSLDDFSELPLNPTFDPPYIASGYVSGVCNHTVTVISN